MTLGARIIEKHFNLGDKKTLDLFSLDEKDFELMVDKIRETEKVLGEHEYSISKSSIKNLKAKGQSIFQKYKKMKKFRNLMSRLLGLA